MSGPPLRGWVPFRLYWQAEEPGVEWMYLGERRFDDPFFEETIYREAQTPFNTLFRFRTPLEALAGWRSESPGLQPAGFLFHLSRCGSTLITRMLASPASNLVLSEPGVLERMLRSGERAPGIPDARRAKWLEWLVSALGQPRTGQEERLFIKFDPRNIADLPLLRMVFPEVPWIFVYRDPVEVLVSNLRSPSLLVTRGTLGPDFLNFDGSLVAGMDDGEYAARALGIVAETAARHAAAAGSAGMLIEYRQLPDIVWGDLARHFGVEFTPREVEQLRQVAQFDAKRPERRFASDTEAKQRDASVEIRRLAAQWIGPHYARLEEIRRAQTPGEPARHEMPI